MYGIFHRAEDVPYVSSPLLGRNKPRAVSYISLPLNFILLIVFFLTTGFLLNLQYRREHHSAY